jgi:hypothetical protein
VDKVRAGIRLGELVGMTLTDFDVQEDEIRLCFEDTVVVIAQPRDMEVR